MSANMRSNCCGVACLCPGRAHPGPERKYQVVEPVVRQIWLTANSLVASVWRRFCGSGFPTMKSAMAN